MAHSEAESEGVSAFPSPPKSSTCTRTTSATISFRPEAASPSSGTATTCSPPHRERLLPSLDALPAQMLDPEIDLLPDVCYLSSASSSSLGRHLDMFTAQAPYAGEFSLEPFDDLISICDVATSEYRPYPPDHAAVQMAATGGPPRCQQQRPASDEEFHAAVAAAVGMTPPLCAVLDGSGVGASYHWGGSARGDGPHGFFPAGGMMAAGPEVGPMGSEHVADYQAVLTGSRMYGLEAPPLRACHTGNLQSFICLVKVIGGGSQHLMAGNSGNPTPLPGSNVSAMDESTFKVGRLSVEERKEKITRYIKKRNQRNFSKKIKVKLTVLKVIEIQPKLIAIHLQYACRKTLADSRPRVRGRFAKNDEFGEMTKPSSRNHEMDEEVVMKEEDILDSSDILVHISGMNSFKNNFTLESWI
ncbi:unnamed protein product [Musa acuminata var. zebrina]